MKKFFIRWKYRLPKFINNVWYNQSCYMEKEKYPVIFDSNKHYISCTIGQNVVMGETKDSKKIYYTIISKRYTNGGDWLSPSDAINCNLKFSHIK